MSDAFNKERLDHPDRRWTAPEVLALVKDVKPDFTPGTDYAYSNTNYILLGEVIRNISERSWEQEVRRRILDPLNLDSTHIAESERVPEPVIPGYFDADNDGDVENMRPVNHGQRWKPLKDPPVQSSLQHPTYSPWERPCSAAASLRSRP